MKRLHNNVSSTLHVFYWFIITALIHRKTHEKSVSNQGRNQDTTSELKRSIGHLLLRVLLVVGVLGDHLLQVAEGHLPVAPQLPEQGGVAEGRVPGWGGEGGGGERGRSVS